jgi:hypothetical protein
MVLQSMRSNPAFLWLAALLFLGSLPIRSLGQPLLTLHRTTNGYEAAWPTHAGGFRLTTTASLNPPVVWTNWPGPVTRQDTRYFATAPFDAAARFFRLEQMPFDCLGGCDGSNSTPWCLTNGGFQLDTLAGWTISGVNNDFNAVLATVETNADTAGNFACRLRVEPPLSPFFTPLTSMSGIVSVTPATPFYVVFDARFLAASGTLTVTMNGSSVATWTAPATPDTNLTRHRRLIGSPAVLNATNATLTFTYQANPGSHLLLDNIQLASGEADLHAIYQGDPIGNSSASTDGMGAQIATSAENVPSELLPFDWDFNTGNPAFLFVSDGTATLADFRAVVTARRFGGGAVYWDVYRWALTVWTESAYLAKGNVLNDVYLGNPTHWQGTAVVDPFLTEPTQPFFGHPLASDPAAKSYDLRWDLTQFPVFNTALPPGRYIIGFRGVSAPSFQGYISVSRTFDGVGPTPYYSRTATDFSLNQLYGPAPAIPDLRSEPTFRWAMTLTERRTTCD